MYTAPIQILIILTLTVAVGVLIFYGVKSIRRAYKVNRTFNTLKRRDSEHWLDSDERKEFIKGMYEESNN